MRRLGAWLDDRAGIRRLVAIALEEPVRGGASWTYVFGSVLTFLLLLQIATGVLLALYYSPSSTDAWASVAYIQTQVSLGWFIRGLHGYGASAIVILAGLHLLQVAVYGAYKAPRELGWLVGAILLAVILAFALTGYLLPWDQKGYWATRVATTIAGGTPLIGGWLQRLVQGGNEYGNLTLTRFFASHVFLLPGAAFVLVAGHLYLFRRHGVTPRWGRSDAELSQATQPFWPEQLARDMAAILVVFGMLALFVMVRHGVSLEAPADPTSSFDARPEWYFLPLYEALKLVTGPLEKVVALGAPLVVGAVLVGLPFVDRGADRSPRARAPFLAVLLLGFVGAGALTAASLVSDARDGALAKRQVAARAKADKALLLAKDGVPVAGGMAVFENEPFFRARQLFAERCAGCHQGHSRKGPEIGPGYGSRAWIRALLTNPNEQRFFGVVAKVQASKSKMSPTKYTGSDLDAVVEMVYAESGATDVDAGLSARGQTLFDSGPCSDCHARDLVTVDDPGPNLGDRGSPRWLAAFIADPGHERFFGKLNEMPAFQDKLDARAIGDLADYVASLARE